MGRRTPHGTVVGLMMAAELENLDRAAEYLAPVTRLPNRGELARKLWVVLDRKLFTSLDSVSDQPDGDLGDGLTNRDRIGLVDSPSGNVEIFLDRVQRVPALPSGCSPPARCRRSLGSLMKSSRRGSNGICRSGCERRMAVPATLPWLAILLLIPLAFGLARLSARALTVCSVRCSAGSRATAGRQAGERGTTASARSRPFFYTASFFGFTLATRHFWYRVAVTLVVIALCWLSLRLVDVLAELSLKRLQRFRRSGDTALVRLIGRLLKAATVTVAALVLLFLWTSISRPRSPGWASAAWRSASAPRKRSRTCSAASW